MDIQQSPQLSDAPIDFAVLAVGTEPQPYNVGDIAVMSANGDWRVVERDLLGMRDSHIVEQQFELSPDGSTLALGDAFGVVFVDLASGAAKRVSTDVKDPVLHFWTAPDGGVVLTRRGGASRAWVVMAGGDGTVPRVPFDPWRSAQGADGVVAEFAPQATEARSKRSFTEVRMWSDGRLLRTQPLLGGVPQEAFIADTWSTLVGFRQHRSRRMDTVGGLGTLDPNTGEMVGFLHLPPEQSAWASVQGVKSNRWLLLSIPFGDGGGIFAWDPVNQLFRAVTQIDEEGATVSVAKSRL